MTKSKDILAGMAEKKQAIEAAIKAAQDYADEYGLEFFLEGRGKYYGKPLREEFDSSGDNQAYYVDSSGWNSSACW